MSKKNLRIIIILILCVVAILAYIFLMHKPTLKLNKPVAIDTQGQPFIGDSKAKNNIVVFEDMKCSNCMRYNSELFPKIKKAYVDNGKSRYTIITLAFIPGSPAAANAALCVNQQNKQAFMPYVEYIYHHQGSETDNWANVPTLLKYASNVPGIDVNKLSLCLVRSPFSGQINKNMGIAQKIMGETVMTPRVYINGVLVDPLTYDHFNNVFRKVSK